MSKTTSNINQDCLCAGTLTRTSMLTSKPIMQYLFYTCFPAFRQMIRKPGMSKALVWNFQKPPKHVLMTSGYGEVSHE